MVESFREHVDLYLGHITPKPNDPTYSILKAHLLFEEMLRAYLRKKLPNPDALDGARLSFSQKLALSRSLTPVTQVQAWVWTGVEKLNTLRNHLAHGAGNKDIEKEVDKYVKFIIHAGSSPLPEPKENNDGLISNKELKSPKYLAVDMVTVRMYYHLSGALGFKID